MAVSSFNELPEVDSELFEQVSDDEFALLEYYRALRPTQRAAGSPLIDPYMPISCDTIMLLMQ